MADLPAYGLVDVAGQQRIAGALEEAEIGGVRFVKVSPHRAHSVLVNPSHIITIHPCDELSARKIADHQWQVS